MDEFRTGAAATEARELEEEVATVFEVERVRVDRASLKVLCELLRERRAASALLADMVEGAILEDDEEEMASEVRGGCGCEGYASFVFCSPHSFE